MFSTGYQKFLYHLLFFSFQSITSLVNGNLVHESYSYSRKKPHPSANQTSGSNCGLPVYPRIPFLRHLHIASESCLNLCLDHTCAIHKPSLSHPRCIASESCTSHAQFHQSHIKVTSKSQPAISVSYISHTCIISDSHPNHIRTISEPYPNHI